MKVITRGVIDWASLAIEECEFFDHDGPVSQCKDSGSPPQAVDPYTQAAAQYGLATNTALFNAGLNRTNSVNPLGSSSWTASYPAGSAPGAAPSTGLTSPSASSPGARIPYTSFGNNGMSLGQVPAFGLGGSGVPVKSGPAPSTNITGSPTGGAPTYTQTTSLNPWANDMLSKPIDTSGIAGMPGGPSTTQDLKNTQDALYQSQEQYLKPEQQLATEQLQSQLANQGIMPGSAAYNNEMDRLSREQEFQNSSARTNAITGAGAEQSRLFGLGSQSLQNQLAIRNAPISEYNALSGNGGGSASAQTPDISGAFNQQLQSQIAGYNAQTASNNATTSDIASIAMLALMFSDERLKENVRKVGKTDQGLPVYTYNYKGNPETHMGVMAQDVEKVQPEAVFGLGGRDNLKMVDYRQVA